MTSPTKHCCSVFVYGTLMQGQCRAHCWPHPPLSIHPARVRGLLFDLGPYPAMIPGDLWILGERWRVAERHLQETLSRLDEIEAVAEDLYRRAIVDCWDVDTPTRKVAAFAYLFVDQQRLTRIPAMRPDGKEHCRWRPGTSTDEDT